jgi:hypothetical protein
MMTAGLAILGVALFGSIVSLILIKLRPQVPIESWNAGVAPLLGNLFGWGSLAFLAGWTEWKIMYLILWVYTLAVLWMMFIGLWVIMACRAETGSSR